MPHCMPRTLVGSMAAASLLACLTACGEDNRYIAPPPAQVTVAVPIQKSIARYLEETGNASAKHSIDLVARVQGYVQAIQYQDGAFVKKGTSLFLIEPEPYQLKVDQAVASQMGAQASFDQLEAEFKRQSDLATREFASKAALDQARAASDNAKAKLLQSQADRRQAEINLSYTEVKAPIDGIVTASAVSVGQLVGAGAATVLATIVQIDPIHVNFSVAEPVASRLYSQIAASGKSIDLFVGKTVVEVGSQTDTGYPYHGVLDYVAPTIDPSTGTLAVRATFANPKKGLLPGNFVRVRILVQENVPSLLVPDVALGSEQGQRFVLLANKDNIVEQRQVRIGLLVGDLRVIESGLKPDDRVIVDGLQRAIPGHKVVPQVRTASSEQGRAQVKAK
jgi:RND family efflux transporter MFP subunit